MKKADSGRLALSIVCALLCLSAATALLAADKQEKMNSHAVSEWRKAKYKDIKDYQVIDFALKKADYRQDMADYFLQLYKMKQDPRDIGDSFDMFRNDPDDLKNFWKRVTDPNWPTKYDDVKKTYRFFGKNTNLRELAFYYRTQGLAKKIDVSMNEIMEVIKFCKGDEKLIAFYFNMRIDQHKPAKDCVAALKEKAAGETPEDKDKKVQEEARKMAEDQKEGSKEDAKEGAKNKAGEKKTAAPAEQPKPDAKVQTKEAEAAKPAEQDAPKKDEPKEAAPAAEGEHKEPEKKGDDTKKADDTIILVE